MIDTHAHLDDDQFSGEVDQVIARAIASGVRRIINIGYRPKRWRTTLELADRFPEIAFTLGLHPHHVDEWTDTIEVELLDLIRSQRPVAVGEIGLDYYRNLNPKPLQCSVFERQLAIASACQLPAVIHQRQAEADLIAILESAPSELVCVLHSFDGTADLADFAFRREYYVGVGGLMTRPASIEVRNVLASVPLNRMLLETDSPYLVPTGVSNRRNEPANVTIVAKRLADLLGVAVDEVAQTCTENAEMVFGPLLSSAPPEPKSVRLPA